MSEKKMTPLEGINETLEEIKTFELDDPFRGLPFYKEPYYKFLHLYAKKMKPKVMVELGTYYGTAALALALGNTVGHVHTADIRMDIFRLYEGWYDNITRLDGDSIEVSDQLPKEFDLLYIDTEHTYERVAAEYNHYLHRVKKGGVIFLDDIHFNDDMETFWEKIKEEKVELNELHWPGWGAVLV